MATTYYFTVHGLSSCRLRRSDYLWDKPAKHPSQAPQPSTGQASRASQASQPYRRSDGMEVTEMRMAVGREPR